MGLWLSGVSLVLLDRSYTIVSGRSGESSLMIKCEKSMTVYEIAQKISKMLSWASGNGKTTMNNRTMKYCLEWVAKEWKVANASILS